MDLKHIIIENKIFHRIEDEEEKDNGYELIINELNSINIFEEPDVSANILDTLKEIGTSLKS